MKILFIEDDDYKRNSVIAFLKENFEDISIDTGISVESGVQQGVDNHYDLILLDMTIPNFDKTAASGGGQSFKNGGEIIVRELLDEGILFKCAILTQYETFNDETIEQISDRITHRCGSNYLGYVKYNKLDEEWKDKLKKLLQNVKNTNH